MTLTRLERRFVKQLASEIRQSLGTAPPVEEVLAYLVEHNMIERTVPPHYLVVTLYPERYREYGSKRQALMSLSDEVELELRQLYNIIEKRRKAFWKRHCTNAKDK